jgi:hypothetical protein
MSEAAPKTEEANTAGPNTAGMAAARRRDSAAKRARVLTAVQTMTAAGDPVTFAAVARRARVSTWLVYAPGVRDAIEAARAQQRDHPVDATPPTGSGVADLRTDLALARAEITKLRAERDQHQQQLRRALGAQLDSIARTDLAARVDELTRANAELTANAAHQHTVNQTLQAQITTLEDELVAARTSLRRMIRTENRPADA